jgi:hypothetical protein
MQSGNYVSVWRVNKGKGNYYDVNISCSRKRKDTNEYVQDFNGFVRFVGTAADGIAKYDGFNFKDNGNKPLRIKIGNFAVENNYNKENGVTYWRVAVFSFEDQESSSDDNNDFMKLPEGSEEELPFN